MTSEQIKIINKQLEDVQARILENLELQRKYPNQKRSLLIGLKTLKHLEHDMIDSLKDAYLISNREVYETRITGKNVVDGTIPIMDIGKFFVDKQTVFNTFGSEKALGRNANIKSDVKLDCQFNLAAVAAGSFRIILTSSQKVLLDADNAETKIKHAYKDIQNLIELGMDKELLKKAESDLGVKKINAYKKFLETLFETGMNIEFSRRKSDKTDLTLFSIKKEQAKEIFDVLIETDNKDDDIITLTGVIGAFDYIVKRPKFKIVDEHEKTTQVYFDRHFTDEVLNHVKKLSKVNVKQITQDRGIGQTEFIEYHLISFDED